MSDVPNILNISNMIVRKYHGYELQEKHTSHQLNGNNYGYLESRGTSILNELVECLLSGLACLVLSNVTSGQTHLVHLVLAFF